MNRPHNITLSLPRRFESGHKWEYKGLHRRWLAEAEAAIRRFQSNQDVSALLFKDLDTRLASNRPLPLYIIASSSNNANRSFLNDLRTRHEAHATFTFDLSALRSEATLSTLQGSPPGYVGFDPAGSAFFAQLATMQSVWRRLQHCSASSCVQVPLLDFVNPDLAHPAINTALATFYTQGVFRDSRNKTVDLSRCIRFMRVQIPRATGAMLLGRPLNERQALVARYLGSVERDGIPAIPPAVLGSAVILPMQITNPEDRLHILEGCMIESLNLFHPDVPVAVAPELLLEQLAKNNGNQGTQGEMTTKSSLTALGEEDRFRVFKTAETLEPGNVILVERAASREDPERRFRFSVRHVSEVRRPITCSFPVHYLSRCGYELPRTAFWTIPNEFDSRLQHDICGQEKNLSALCSLIHFRHNQSSLVGPFTSILLVGPTGTGKTALPLAIAEATGAPLLKLDCNTLQDGSQLWRAIFGQADTSLISRLIDNPQAVVLFDESDKAHSSLWEYMLSALDTGSLKDEESGRSVSLKQAMVFFTSNQLAGELSAYADRAREETVTQTDSTLRRVLARSAGIPPECLSRLDFVMMMLPVSGLAAVPLWNKLALMATSADATSSAVSSDVAEYLEFTHHELGGDDSARSRIRTVQTVFTSGAITTDGGLVSLRPEAAQKLKQNGRVQSERQRLWGVTDERMNRFKEEYSDPSGNFEPVFSLLRRESRKVAAIEPVGVILLVGPTGSGKTHFGRALSTAFSKGDLVKVECAQCAKESEIPSMLFGGAVGSEMRRGILTGAIMMRKDRVVVFDEIERGHPSLIDRVINVLGEGYAYDQATQLPVDLRECFFILTTNAGQEEVSRVLSQLDSNLFEDRERATRAVIASTGLFAPEHLSRIKFVIPVLPQKLQDTICTAFGQLLREYGRSNITLSPEALKTLCTMVQPFESLGIRGIKNRLDDLLSELLFTQTTVNFAIRDGAIYPKELLSSP